MIALLLAAGAAFLANDLPVQPATVCKPQRGVMTSRIDPGVLARPLDRALAHRLGDMPKANLEVAIRRTVSGCEAPVIVSYKVEGDGRFASDGRR